MLSTDDSEIYSQPEKVDFVGQSTFADIGKKFGPRSFVEVNLHYTE